VTAASDFERVVETFKAAIGTDTQGFDIGFALPGRPTRVVWVDVEVIPEGVLLQEELPPGVPAGSKAFDMRVMGFHFVEHPDAEAPALRPIRSADRPWFLTNYPGQVSWKRLCGAAQRLGPSEDWRALQLNDPLKYWWRSRRWARLMARSPSDVVEVFDRDGERICSGLLTRRPEGRAALVPDHHYVLANYAMKDGELVSRFFLPWPSLHIGATYDAEELGP